MLAGDSVRLSLCLYFIKQPQILPFLPPFLVLIDPRPFAAMLSKRRDVVYEELKYYCQLLIIIINLIISCGFVIALICYK